MVATVSKVIRVKYEKGLLKPLDPLDAKEGEILLVRVVDKNLADRVFGSIKIDKRKLEETLREAEDELGIY
jgi:predicted DNA-binding antitoxin AbrB/MazE fold protein